MSVTTSRFRAFFPFIILCLLPFILTSCGSQKTIVNGLDEREANEILVFLGGKGIDANKVQSTIAAGAGGGGVVLWDISVSKDRSTEAMALLNAAGLPRRRSQNLLGIFSGQGLVPSEMEQKIRYQAGLAEQIANIIRKIDGILDADVQLSFPEEDPLNPNAVKGKVTASVYVKHSGVLDDPNSHLITRIKRLVASSVPGLNYDDVTVIPDRARYSELANIGSQGSVVEEPKEYVNIWSIVLAKESVSRFRLIFFSFSLLILILLLSLIWIGWKFHKVLQQSGGYSQLFHIHPISAEGLKPEEKPSEDTEEEKKEGEEEQIVKGEEDEAEAKEKEASDEKP